MGDHQNSHVKLDKEHIEHTDFREMPKMSYFSLFFFFFGKMKERQTWVVVTSDIPGAVFMSPSVFPSSLEPTQEDGTIGRCFFLKN